MELAHRLASSDLAKSTSPYEDHIKGKVTQGGENFWGPSTGGPQRVTCRNPVFPASMNDCLLLTFSPTPTAFLSDTWISLPLTFAWVLTLMPSVSYGSHPLLEAYSFNIWAFHGLKGPPWQRVSVSEPHVGTAMWANWHGTVQKKPLATMKRFLLLQAVTHFLTLKGLQLGLKKL